VRPETLERCIYWQRHVMNTTTDPAQRERCRRAVEKLTAQLKQAQEANE
jgi:hypothetical protein